jgi:DNA-binding MarR family transcriptional regulator
MGKYRLEDSIGYLVYRTALKMKNELLQTFKAHGYDVTPEQWAVLVCLSEIEGQTQTELAERVVKDKTNLSRILDGMAAKELIVRRPNEDDRRSYRIYLTPSGEELTNQITPLAISGKGIQSLSEQDRQELVRLMNAIYQNLS